MALIYTDSNREDIDYVQKHWNIDFDIGLYNGSDNDFEINHRQRKNHPKDQVPGLRNVCW